MAKWLPLFVHTKQAAVDAFFPYETLFWFSLSQQQQNKIMRELFLCPFQNTFVRIFFREIFFIIHMCLLFNKHFLGTQFAVYPVSEYILFHPALTA